VETKQRKKMLQAVQIWAERHPEKHKPIMQLLGGDQYSPMEIAIALTRQDEIGRFLWAMLETASSECTPDLIANSFAQMFPAHAVAVEPALAKRRTLRAAARS